MGVTERITAEHEAGRTVLSNKESVCGISAESNWGHLTPKSGFSDVYTSGKQRRLGGNSPVLEKICTIAGALRAQGYAAGTGFATAVPERSHPPALLRPGARRAPPGGGGPRRGATPGAPSGNKQS
eukprot:4319603-Pyramimonas_sp.AAC.1